jgi:hypothetical protein
MKISYIEILLVTTHRKDVDPIAWVLELLIHHSREMLIIKTFISALRLAALSAGLEEI